jgi:predicted Fe-Mo cluster-binding NifX family protein
MKVAVCAGGDTPESAVDQRFGGCAYLLITDTESLDFTAVQNPGSLSPQGAGVQAAQVVSSMGVSAVIAGNFGPNAFQALSAAGIRVYTGAVGTVRRAVEQITAGQLQEVSAPTVAGHHGMNAAPGRGFGLGAGARRGMGRHGGFASGGR